VINVVIFNDIEDEPDGGEASSSVALARVAAADVEAPAAPRLPVDALARLPEFGDRGGDAYWRLATAFLVGYPPHSSRAYFGDLKACTPGAPRRACIRCGRDVITSTSGPGTSQRTRSPPPGGRRRRRRSRGVCRA